MGDLPGKETAQENTVTNTVTTRDGLTLVAEVWRPAGPARAVVVLIHGFSAHCGNFRHVASALGAAGMATVLFDSRGHGRSQGRRGFVRRFSDYSDDLGLVLALARASVPGAPVALLGHSQGGAVALDYLMDGHGAADALVLAAPWLALKLKVPTFKVVLARLTGQLWPTLTMGNEIKPQMVSRNPEVIAGWDADTLIHHVATPRWFNEVRRAQARIQAAPDKLQIPTFLMAAGDDRLVSTEAALAFARAVGARVDVRSYPGLYHELFLEPERDAVIGDMVGWLGRRFPA
jgi:alpha-beta hydrolase superfamily lysophospholipase